MAGSKIQSPKNPKNKKQDPKKLQLSCEKLLEVNQSFYDRGF